MKLPRDLSGEALAKALERLGYSDSEALTCQFANLPVLVLTPIFW